MSTKHQVKSPGRQSGWIYSISIPWWNGKDLWNGRVGWSDRVMDAGKVMRIRTETMSSKRRVLNEVNMKKMD